MYNRSYPWCIGVTLGVQLELPLVYWSYPWCIGVTVGVLELHMGGIFQGET